MARLLVVGAGPLQVPLIMSARNAGHWVLAADMDPSAVGIRLADAFAHASTIDADALTKAAKAHRVEGIVTAATDQPLPAIALAARACGLRALSEETALRATRKDLMRQALREDGVPCPDSHTVETIGELEAAWERLPHPIIVKPVDSSGSRGVSRVDETQGLGPALGHALAASRRKAAVAERFLEGREFSVETLSFDGALRLLQITEKETTGPPHFVESGHLQPARLSPADWQAVEAITASAARALGILEGPTHTEVMVTADGPFIVEVGARLGGDYITSDLVPLSTGIDMYGLVIELCLGRAVTLPPFRSNGAAIRYLYPPCGRVRSVEGLANARAGDGIVRIEVFKGTGETIVPVTGSHERAGYVITRGDTADEALTRAERARDAIRFIMETS